MITRRNRVLPDVAGVLLDERQPAYLRTLAKWVLQSMYRVNSQLRDTDTS